MSGFQDARAVKKGVAGLESAKGFIQTTLSKKLRVRQFPKLAFFFDESVKQGFEMVQKIESVMAADKESRPAGESGAESPESPT